MIDLFDILKNQKNNRINIKGIVSEYSALPFTVGDINEIVSLLINNDKSVEIMSFKVTQEKPKRDIGTIGLHGSSYEWDIETVSFDIDVKVTTELYNTIYTEFEDFIDYFTPGNIKYDYKEEEIMITRDDTDYEEYTSARVNASWDDVLGVLSSQAAYYDDYTDWQIGSHPRFERNYDADGDVMFAASFSLGNPRPAIDGGDR